MKSRLVRTVVLVATLLIAVLVVFPLAFGPGVDAPTARFPGNPFYLEVKISNENLTPVTNMEFTCEAVQVELASGVKLSDATVINQGHVRRLQGRKAISARCETAYIVDAPIKSAEFKLTLKYRAYPWPYDRTSEYRFAAVVDSKGQVTRWARK